MIDNSWKIMNFRADNLTIGRLSGWKFLPCSDADFRGYWVHSEDFSVYFEDRDYYSATTGIVKTMILTSEHGPGAIIYWSKPFLAEIEANSIEGIRENPFPLAILEWLDFGLQQLAVEHKTKLPQKESKRFSQILREIALEVFEVSFNRKNHKPIHYLT